MNNLTDIEIRALNEALDDEYHSWATYDQVIADFGKVQPFSNIREAEAHHIESLRTLFVRYELPMPKNSWPGKVERYASLQAACKAAVAAEIANGAMYDRLLIATQRPDIIKVLHNLQKASEERHLPAFQRCAQNSGCSGGMGHGLKHRQGGRS